VRLIQSESEDQVTARLRVAFSIGPTPAAAALFLRERDAGLDWETALPGCFFPRHWFALAHLPAWWRFRAKTCSGVRPPLRRGHPDADAGSSVNQFDEVTLEAAAQNGLVDPNGKPTDAALSALAAGYLNDRNLGDPPLEATPAPLDGKD